MLATDFRNNDVNEILKDNKFNESVAKRYLNTYVGFNTDWSVQIDYIWQRILKTKGSNEDHQKLLYRAIACAVLLPAVDRSTYIDIAHPENLLLKISGYKQLQERDWFQLFQDTYRKDMDNEDTRNCALALGVIHPFDLAPYPRQAFNWLYERAERSGVITDDDIKHDISARFENLVQAYGGAVICNVFTRHDGEIKNLVNWRTGYFFERAINNVYTREEILKIKKLELEKTNKNLIKSIKII